MIFFFIRATLVKVFKTVQRHLIVRELNQRMNRLPKWMQKDKDILEFALSDLKTAIHYDEAFSLLARDLKKYLQDLEDFASSEEDATA